MLPAARTHRRHRSLGALPDDALLRGRAPRLTVITATHTVKEEGEGSEDEVVTEEDVLPGRTYVPKTALAASFDAVPPLSPRRVPPDMRKALGFQAAVYNFRQRQISAGELTMLAAEAGLKVHYVDGVLSPDSAATPPTSAAILQWTMPSPGLESPVPFAAAHRRRATDGANGSARKPDVVAPPSLEQIVEWQRQRRAARVVSTVIEEATESTRAETAVPPSPSIRVDFAHQDPIFVKPMARPANRPAVDRAACARRLVSTLSRRVNPATKPAPIIAVA